MIFKKYEIAFLIKTQEIFFLQSWFLFRARKFAKRFLRFNPLLDEAVILKRGIEKEWFYSPFKKKDVGLMNQPRTQN